MQRQIEVRSQIRIPAALHMALSKAAHNARRSLNDEVLQRLEVSFKPELDLSNRPSAGAGGTDPVLAGMAEINDGMQRVLRQLGSERALIRSLALAVVSSTELARKHENNALPESAAEVLRSLQNLAARFLKQDDETAVYKHIASDWEAK